jgi:hypothetical protein
MSETSRATAKQVAKTLGLTVRRVHQLVEELILPEPDNEKRFDLDLCDLRYMLFKVGTQSQWEDFCDDVEAEAHDVETAVNIALADKPTDKQVDVAARMVMRHYSNMLFLATCRGKTAVEKNLYLDKFERERDELMGGLIYQRLRGRALVDENGTVLIPARKEAA